ncbi:NFkB inhibitor [Hypsugopox virus]|nr:NFkB inhibitor [Hypsugopox virus]
MLYIFSLCFVFISVINAGTIQQCSKASRNRFWKIQSIVELGLKYKESTREGECVTKIINNGNQHSVSVSGYGIELDYTTNGGKDDIVGVAQGIYNNVTLVTGIFTASNTIDTTPSVPSTSLTVTCTELNCNGISLHNNPSSSITVIGSCITCANMTVYPEFIGKILDLPSHIKIFQSTNVRFNYNISSVCNVPFDDVSFYLCDRIDKAYSYTGHPRI